MPKRNLVLGAIAMSLVFQISMQAQTYATPELKQKVEAETAAKLKRIKENPEAWRAEGGNPDQLLKEKPADPPAPIVYAPPVDATRRDLYKLAAVDAIDPGRRHTAAEMQGFQAEAAGEFQKTNIVLDWENGKWYFIPRDPQQKPAEKKFRIENGLLQFADCRACQDNTFTIAEQREDALVLRLKPQDEGQFFVFSFTFKK